MIIMAVIYVTSIKTIGMVEATEVVELMAIGMMMRRFRLATLCGFEGWDTNYAYTG